MKRTVRRLALAALLGAGVVAAARAVRPRRRALERVAPPLRHPLLLAPLHLNNRLTLAVARKVRGMPTPLAAGVSEREVLGALIFTPLDRPRPCAALLWIHGGGYVMGRPAGYRRLCSEIAAELGIVVVAVDYRLAPEHPFPAALEDCYAALRWVHEHADRLGVDRARVAIGGDSAGGGLAATLAQLAYDRGELPVRFQLLAYPMLDDRTVLRGDHAGVGEFLWTPASNRYGWTAYLGHPPRDDDPRPYVAAARRTELSGLPPAWIGVGDLDLFHAEDVTYAQRLTEAGVPCELYVEPGLYHAADQYFPDRVPGLRKSMLTALRSALD